MMSRRSSESLSGPSGSSNGSFGRVLGCEGADLLYAVVACRCVSLSWSPPPLSRKSMQALFTDLVDPFMDASI